MKAPYKQAKFCQFWQLLSGKQKGDIYKMPKNSPFVSSGSRMSQVYKQNQSYNNTIYLYVII